MTGGGSRLGRSAKTDAVHEYNLMPRLDVRHGAGLVEAAPGRKKPT